MYDIEYTQPREVSRGSGISWATICQRLSRAGVNDLTRLGGFIGRWWRDSTHPEYLASDASRRGLWRVLLPLPAFLIMLADQGRSNLVIFDAAGVFGLWVAAALPSSALWSDAAIGVMDMAFILARWSFGAQGSSLFRHGQVLVLLSMASAGVHGAALVVYILGTFFGAAFLFDSWNGEQLAGCIYVLIISTIWEQQVAQLVCGRAGVGSGYNYKALNLLSHPPQDMFTDAGDRGAWALPSRATGGSAGPLSRAADLEGLEGLEEARSPSRTSAADDALSRVAPPAKEAATAELAFSQLAPAPGRDERGEGQRSTPAKVRAPGAASHEAGSVAEETVPRLHAPEPRGSPPPRSPPTSPASPTSPGSVASGGQPLRAVRLRGFQMAGLNALFIESVDSELQISERETYWSESGDYFLYRSASTGTWGAAKAKRFAQIRLGQSNGVAHSPEGFDIAQSSSKAAWREWDVPTSKWVVRENSGVESRGKVRKKSSPLDKAVQTDFAGVKAAMTFG